MDSGSRWDEGRGEDPLAYGDYHHDPAERPPEEGEFDGAGEGERGLVGDTYRKIRSKYRQDQYGGVESSKPSGGLGSFIFHKLHDAVNDIGSKLDANFPAGAEAGSHGHTHSGTQIGHGSSDNNRNRYASFATQRTGNDVKWFVDGCGYMWAVSRALEQATTSVWILDCKKSITPCHFVEA